MISGDFDARVAGELVDRGVELVDRHDPVHEADAAASAASTRRPVVISSSTFFGGIERSSGTVIMYGQRPTLISGRAELGVVGGDHEVAGEREPEPAGEGVAAHPGDRRLPECPQVPEQVGEQAPTVVRGGVAIGPGDPPAPEVGAGAERLVARRR